ncbi:SDR family oxidoreductase [Rhodopseudomonas palustris]|uniref:SDR family oxidoreductase n=1 Tax=Rhodopseudomonas palustris TaxID=1076 RepID=A0A418V0Q8_RHOPL|nr:SDR family oxidoreductase [Rhodopseudomonas palustris]RJF69409.1 SDR family oxidoreductase [Rhodopseudomonas palustris]
MDLGIKGRTALVTAASRGIGRACADLLAAEGCNVSICARHEVEIQKAAGEIQAASGARVIGCTADLSVASDLDSMVSRTVAEFGGLDILIAICASPRRGNFESLTDADLTAAFEATVLPLARLVRLVLPHMQAKGWGRVVTVQARSVREPIPDLVASNATRPGAAGLMKSLSRDYAADGILFNTIVPGRIFTERFKGGVAVSDMDSAAYYKSKLSDIPLQRFGTPDDIASVAAFLVSERSAYVTGAAIPVDGGVIRSI